MKSGYIIVILFLCLQIPGFDAVSQISRLERCIAAVAQMPAVSPTDGQISHCLTECDISQISPSMNVNYTDINTRYQYCLQLRSDNPTVRAACVAAHEALLACSSNCDTQYNACVSECQRLPNPTEVTEYMRRCEANRNGNGRAAEPTEPVEPPPGPDQDSDTPVSADNTTPDQIGRAHV